MLGIARDPKIETLRRVPVLAELPRRQLRRIACRLDILVLEPGERLVGDDQPGREFFVVADGVAALERDATCIGALRRGDIGGEMAALSDDGAIICNVIARTEMQLLVGTRRDLAPLLADHLTDARPAADADARQSTAA